jgi:Transposase and inactivated derivatives
MRALWPKVIEEVSVRNLVFIDESSANTCLAKLRGWWRKGERLRSFVPCGRWHTTTMICAIRYDGVFAPLIMDGAMDGESFQAYVEQILIPALSPDDVVVMDNLSTHKTTAVESALRENGIQFFYLPPYSPDLNPIENMWSKVKSVIRCKTARTLHALMYAMAEAIEMVTPEDCQGYFAHAGYHIHENS